jgi:hypothetical protein
MSNVEGSKYFEQVEEWSVPLREDACTRRDICDLLRVADKHVEATETNGLTNDDVYYVKVVEDRLVVQFRTRVEKNAAVLT